jgi:hypothetical protein
MQVQAGEAAIIESSMIGRVRVWLPQAELQPCALGQGKEFLASPTDPSSSGLRLNLEASPSWPCHIRDAAPKTAVS